MNTLRNTVLAAAAFVAIATPALAQEGSLSDDRFMMVNANGKFTVVAGNPKTHEMMMKMGKQVKAGTVFYMSGGKLYMAEGATKVGSTDFWSWMSRANSDFK